MSNGRKVSTDALETLGQIIDETQKRDAIHLAVEPVQAAEDLMPGQRITIIDGLAFRATLIKDALGIVDPFLTTPVKKGQRFWFVMNPREVTSLRHVWTHPAFDVEMQTDIERHNKAQVTKAASEEWLRNFCITADCPDYETTLEAAANCDDEYLHFDEIDAHGDIPPEFWDHVEIVIGRKVKVRAEFFSCSC